MHTICSHMSSEHILDAERMENCIFRKPVSNVVFFSCFFFFFRVIKSKVLIKLNIALITKITWSLNRFLIILKKVVSHFSCVCYVTDSKLTTNTF